MLISLPQSLFHRQVCCLFSIYNPIATCVQNNSWKGGRGAEQQGDIRKQAHSQNHYIHYEGYKDLIIQLAAF